jgi:hypothetical protein
MNDPALALTLAIVFLAALALVRWFKTLDGNVWRAWRTALPAGAASGVLLHFTGTQPLAAGVILSAMALYVRLTGDESEPSDGMISGAAAGAAAGLIVILLGEAAGADLASCLLAGTAAGFGATFGARYTGQRTRQLINDALTVVAAIGAAALPRLVSAARWLDDRHIAIYTVSLIPLLVIIAVFEQWRDVKEELQHEASLGFIDDADVRPTADPFLRLGRGGWTDRRAHRVFVRLATLLALRKRQQRRRTEEAARLYQLEIIKLRMQIQEMAQIDHAMGNSAEASDTMASHQ